MAILQLLAAAELIEADLWQQYKELGGVDAPDSGYKEGLVILDGDLPQYVHDNTDDELSHAAFLNAYLESKGERQVNLEQFANLPSSKARPGQADGTAHQPHPAQCGYQLVDCYAAHQPRSRCDVPDQQSRV